MYSGDSTKAKLLSIVREEPMTYSQLKQALEITDNAIQRHLNDLQSKDLIKKNESGLYTITNDGEAELLREKSAGEVNPYISDEDDYAVIQKSRRIIVLYRLAKFYQDFLYFLNMKVKLPQLEKLEQEEIINQLHIIYGLLKEYDPDFDEDEWVKKYKRRATYGGVLVDNVLRVRVWERERKIKESMDMMFKYVNGLDESTLKNQLLETLNFLQGIFQRLRSSRET